MNNKLRVFVCLFLFPLIASSPLSSFSSFFHLAPWHSNLILEELIEKGGQDRNKYQDDDTIYRDYPGLNESYHETISRFLASLNSESSPTQPKRILVLGIGAGLVPIHILRRYPHLEVHSISKEDLILSQDNLISFWNQEEIFSFLYGEPFEPKAIQLLKKLRRHFLKFDIQNGLPYLNDFFDAVIVTQCLFGYLHHKASFLNEMIRVTRSSGKIFTDLGQFVFYTEREAEMFRKMPGIYFVSGDNIFKIGNPRPPQKQESSFKRFLRNLLKHVWRFIAPYWNLKTHPKIIIDMRDYMDPYTQTKKPLPFQLRESSQQRGIVPEVIIHEEIYSFGIDLEASL